MSFVFHSCEFRISFSYFVGVREHVMEVSKKGVTLPPIYFTNRGKRSYVLIQIKKIIEQLLTIISFVNPGEILVSLVNISYTFIHIFSKPNLFRL